MFETMREYQGVGLAAPQVHEGVRLFVAGFPARPGDDDDDEDARVPLMALINPEITPAGADIAEDWEGCLEHPRHPRASATGPTTSSSARSIAAAASSS